MSILFRVIEPGVVIVPEDLQRRYPGFHQRTDGVFSWLIAKLIPFPPPCESVVRRTLVGSQLPMLACVREPAVAVYDEHDDPNTWHVYPLSQSGTRDVPVGGVIAVSRKRTVTWYDAAGVRVD